ncbi:MAG: TlpA family protein disulfide reductase [Spirochaetales bacterium]|nr:TlpA family protein disulfide reductase [Spirochaetales bacterium]
MVIDRFLCLLLFSTVVQARDLPAVVLRDLMGRQGSFPSFVTPGPVIVNFWATYCEPCRKEIPELRELARQKAVTVRFISVDSASRENLVRVQAKEQGIELLTLLDRYNNVLKLLKIQDGLPVTLLIHRGKIVYSATGYDGSSTAKLKQAICTHLNAC